MAVINQTRIMETGNHLTLQITHFARGTFPEADGRLGHLPVNRFFTVLENPDGEACFLASGAVHWPLQAGMTYFIPAGCPARVKLSENLLFLSVQFRLQYFSCMDFFTCTRRLFRLSGADWIPELNRAFDSENVFSGAAVLRSVTQDLISRIQLQLQPEELSFFGRLSGFTPVLEYVRDHGDARTTVSELARLSGECRESFSRKFTAASGMSPKEYLMENLTGRAMLLLLRQDLLIKEIASGLGFRSEYYFSRFIRQRTGKSPARLREILRRGV